MFEAMKPRRLCRDGIGLTTSAGDPQVGRRYLVKNTCRSCTCGSGSVYSHGSSQIQVLILDFRRYLQIPAETCQLLIRPKIPHKNRFSFTVPSNQAQEHINWIRTDKDIDKNIEITTENSVWKSGPVRFFGQISTDRNRNRLPIMARPQITGPDRK